MTTTEKKTYRSHSLGYTRKYRQLYNAGLRMTESIIPTQRKLQGLLSIGWSYAQISARTDSEKPLTKAQLQVLTRGTKAGRKRVNIVTARKVDRAYRSLMLEPQSHPHAQRVKTWAKKLGYHPPMAWDDIDDLECRPKGTVW